MIYQHHMVCVVLFGRTKKTMWCYLDNQIYLSRWTLVFILLHFSFNYIGSGIMSTQQPREVGLNSVLQDR